MRRHHNEIDALLLGDRDDRPPRLTVLDLDRPQVDALSFCLCTRGVGCPLRHRPRLRGIGCIDRDRQDSAAGSPASKITITVHMATCGIAAGARPVMTALMDEIYDSKRQDIRVKSAGCIGQCKSEPNVTVEIGGEEAVVYQKMTPDKMRQVYQKHILKGEVQESYRVK